MLAEIGRPSRFPFHSVYLDIVPDLADGAYVLSEERKLVASGDIREILRDAEQLKAWNLL